MFRYHHIQKKFENVPLLPKNQYHNIQKLLCYLSFLPSNLISHPSYIIALNTSLHADMSHHLLQPQA